MQKSGTAPVCPAPQGKAPADIPQGFSDCQKSGVIPSQCAHWRGNPPVFRTFLLKKWTLSLCLGDCHTSDIGHWFAMTGILTRSHAQTISSVRVFFSQKAAANPCRSLFDGMRWWITCAAPARWHSRDTR